MNNRCGAYISIIFLLLLSGCSSNLLQRKDVISIKGSDTMLILTKKLALTYNQIQDTVTVVSEGGGTANGMKALIQGEANIAAASRSLVHEEAKQMADRFNTVSLSYKVAKDALCIYLNPQNPVSDITESQLKDIFTGKIRNWKELGGNDSKIYLMIRNKNSGSYHFFQEHILNAEGYFRDVQVLETTEGISAMVSANVNAIGYGGLVYGSQIKLCRINGIYPTEESIKNGGYPLSRYLYFYVLNTPEGGLKSFIDWVIGKDGQRIVSESGYIPLWSY